MSAQIHSFHIPENAKTPRLLNLFISDGRLWLSERDLISLLWIETIPRQYFRNGDRQLWKYNGRASLFVREEVFWRIHWNGFAESPHLNWLIRVVYNSGKKLDAMPKAMRRTIERKELS